MRHTQDWFVGSQGLELYYQQWQPDRDPKAAIALVHGLGSHSGWFMNLVSPLVDSGYSVYAFDLRGHGRSPGQRGHVDSWAQYRDDFRCFQQWIQSQHPMLPCFALGHSLGGNIVLDYALHYPDALSGVITLAPALGGVDVSATKLFLGRLLSWSCPHFTLDTGLNRQGGSRDPLIVDAYKRDLLRHTKATARFATEFLKTQQWVNDHLSQLIVPVLILHGGDDPIVSPDSGRNMFNQIQTVDKEYREYPQGYHDLHNDICVLTVIRDILYWLERHTQIDCRFCPVQLAIKTNSASH